MAQTATFEENGHKFSVPTGLFINNEFVPSLSGKKFPTVNPATGKTIVEVYEADAQDVDRAVEAAKKAFVSWKQVSPTARGALMFKLASLIERDIAELSRLESLVCSPLFECLNLLISGQW